MNLLSTLKKFFSGTRCVSWVHLSIFHDDPKCELSINLLPTFVNLWVAKGS
jgi:hypothetical protein